MLEYTQTYDGPSLALLVDHDDAVFRRIVEDAGMLRYIGIRHEGAGAFAASAYGKLTGRPAACFSIAGPGATNLLTGLWDANVDRSPVIALTGQVETQVLGPGAFQEVDLQAAFGKVAQWSQPVLHSSKHAELLTEVSYIETWHPLKRHMDNIRFQTGALVAHLALRGVPRHWHLRRLRPGRRRHLPVAG